MSTEQATATQTNETRDAKGRFKLGNPGGPGNPFARQVSALRTAMVNCVKPEMIQAIILSMVQRAMDGNVQAAKLVLEYVIGKPLPAPEPDRMDAHEWAMYKENEPMKRESAAVMGAGLSGDHIQVARVMRPMASAVMMQKYIDKLLESPEERAAKEKAQQAKIAAECAETLSRPAPDFPLTPNGGIRQPSPNGDVGQAPPSPNGEIGQPAPSPNGDFGQPAPSPNGVYGAPPSRNGHHASPPPSSNGDRMTNSR